MPIKRPGDMPLSEDELRRFRDAVTEKRRSEEGVSAYDYDIEATMSGNSEVYSSCRILKGGNVLHESESGGNACEKVIDRFES